MDGNNGIHLSIVLILLWSNICPIGCFFSSSWADSGHVIALNNHNFQMETQEHDVLLVMFYVRWCSHCQRLHPDYEKAGAQLAQDPDLPIQLAKFDCTRDSEAQCDSRYNIHGYPTLRIYRQGQFMGEELNYRNRTTDEIVKTMRNFNRQPGIQRRGCSKCRRIQDQPNRTSTLLSSRWLLFASIALIWHGF